MAPKTMLDARRLVKVYGKDFRAVDDVSFSVAKGQVFCLLGSNGAGKTSTLKIFGGLLRPTSGSALVGGLDVADHPLQTKALTGFLPEAPALYETITGREFLSLLGTLRSMAPEALEARVGRLTTILELDEGMDRQIGTYSKGMRQKLALASAILHEPPVLVLDEPTSGLDPRYGAMVKDWLRELAKRGTTILMSTHITTIAEDVADQVGIIHEGTLRALGPTQELLDAHGGGTLEEAFVAIVGGRQWTI